jgi:hypothetical protein
MWNKFTFKCTAGGSRHALYFQVDETFLTAFVALISFLRVSKPFGADRMTIGKMAAELEAKRFPIIGIGRTLFRLLQLTFDKKKIWYKLQDKMIEK